MRTVEHTSFRTPAYKQLACYQKAEAVFDLTHLFCSRYLSPKDRTFDQMIQAARSGKQNIVEGQAAYPTSVETALKLTNVAKASLHELRTDYEDFLRTHQLRQWEETDPDFIRLRQVGFKHNDTDFYRLLAEPYNAEQMANLVIIMICQTDFLLYRLLQSMHAKFLNEGGFREQLSRERREARINNWNNK